MIFGYENVNAEKRELATPPALFTQSGVNAEFTRQFDDYFTDNFAFRSDMITMHARLSGGVFGESVSDQVIIGKDGWLFFTPTLNDYKKADTLSDNEIYRICRILQIQKDCLAAAGVDFIFTVAPNKASIYGEYMPDRYAVIGSQSNVEKLYAALNSAGFDYLDLHALLRAGGEALYHKLDTHWNNAGAMIAYNALLSRVRQTHPEFAYDTYEDRTPTLEYTWRGDLGGMLYPTADMRDAQYEYDIEQEYTSARKIRSLEDLTIQTTCESGQLDLLMLRDSFANALIPLVSNAFASVTYSRAVPYDYGFLTEDTDVVVLEIVERNLPDLVEKAPLMPAPQISLDAAVVPAELRMDATAEDEGDYLRIAGTALPQDYREDASYDIFVRIDTPQGPRTFVPFPTADGQDTPYANAAFCMRIEKSMMPDDMSVDIILFDGSTYSIDTAQIMPRH